MYEATNCRLCSLNSEFAMHTIYRHEVHFLWCSPGGWGLAVLCGSAGLQCLARA